MINIYKKNVYTFNILILLSFGIQEAKVNKNKQKRSKVGVDNVQIVDMYTTLPFIYNLCIFLKM